MSFQKILLNFQVYQVNPKILKLYFRLSYILKSQFRPKIRGYQGYHTIPDNFLEEKMRNILQIFSKSEIFK